MTAKQLWGLVIMLPVTFAIPSSVARAAPRSISNCQTIGTSGSYILTQNPPSPGNGDCLVIEADFVRIDMNGFTIKENAIANGDGITDKGIARKGIAVRNGVVTGFLVGINLGNTEGALIERVLTISNRHDGMIVGDASTVTSNISKLNGGDGIQTGVGSTINGNTTFANGSIGIRVEGPGGGEGASGSTVTGNTSSNNGLTGIFTRGGDTISGNTVLFNLQGLVTTCPSNIIGNTATHSVQGDIVQGKGPGCNRSNNVPAP